MFKLNYIYHEYSYIKASRVQHLFLWNGGCTIFKKNDIIDGVFSPSMHMYNVADIMHGGKYDSILYGIALYLPIHTDTLFL